MKKQPSPSRREFLTGAAAVATLAPLTSPAVASRTLPENARPWRDRKRFVTVAGVRAAYVESGHGNPIVLLHGNPTSSYLWRNVIPHLEQLGRCVAPDLLGMGDTAKLPGRGPGRYTFDMNRAYLDELLDALDIRQNITLVIHDWGSALGFDFARRHGDRIHAIAYMESILQPPGFAMRTSDTGGEFFARLRSSAGEKLVLEENFFVEKILLDGLRLYLSDVDRDEYRRPFLRAGEDRWPTLDWPRELPLDGQPANNANTISEYSRWLADSPIPKLLVRATPGAIFANPAMLAFARSLPQQQEIMVYGGHFMQEVSADAIGRGIAEWLPRIK